MALQDLTPQLRTRLSRMERAVGWFVFIAVLLLGFGFVYYVYDTAERKGWFLVKAPYYTFVDSATGLRVGDPVKLMGFDAGLITAIQPMPGDQFMYNVYVEFELKAPNYGYIWTEGSRAKVATVDLLGKRVLEVSKGSGGYPTYTFYEMLTVNAIQARNLPESTNYILGEEILDSSGTNLLVKALQPLRSAPDLSALGYSNILVLNTAVQQKTMTGIWNDKEGRYNVFTKKGYYLRADESPAVTDQLQRMVTEVEQALPNILNLTNSLGLVLSNSAVLTSNFNTLAISALPALTNVAMATRHLDQPGALGEWLIPTNINQQLGGGVSNANLAIVAASSNLNSVVENLNRSLDNVANLTSNLNLQVQANSNILTSISEAVAHSDQFVQGLKHFWLFRHLYKTNPPPPKKSTPARIEQSPKGREQRP